MILLAYTIPNIYVFFRICNLYINKGYRMYYTLIYLLLVFLYPLKSYLPDVGLVTGFAENISVYLLPFYLYLFLFTLLFDIFLLLNIFLKILPPLKERTTGFKKTALSVLLLSSAVVVIGGAINFNTIRISEYSISVPGKSSDIRHLKIAFAADFHLDEKTSLKFVESFAENISEIKPDLLLFGGDIAEGEGTGEKMIQFESILKKINPEYGFFTVLGNHEYYRGHDDGIFFERAGIEVLYDSVAVIGNAFNLAGRLDDHFRGRKTIEEILLQTDDSLPVILVDHRPTEIDQASRTATDVQFSGHTHNGQMFPLNLILKNMYELSWGYKKKGNTHFFVTSGIRLWGFPVRTTGKSEIMVVNIEFR